MKKLTKSSIVSNKITFLTGKEILQRKLTDVPRDHNVVYAVKYTRALTRNNIVSITRLEGGS